MRQSACLMVYPITVNNFASLFNCTPGVRLNDGPDIKLFIEVGWGRSFFVCCLARRSSIVGFPLLQCSSGVLRHPDTWRSLGCRKTLLEHWSKRKPTVEPRWAKQQTKKLWPQPTKIYSFMLGPALSLTPDQPACN